VKRLVCVSVLALALAAGCGGSSDQGYKPPAGYTILGHWQGKLHQQGLPDFTVDAQIRSLGAGKSNTVHYTGIDCSGHWHFTGTFNTIEQFREVIESGQGGKCKGVGHVNLKPTGPNEVDYVFHGGGVKSEGTLTRPRPPKSSGAQD